MVSTNLKKQYIQTEADLNAAFKDNMYFGINKTEGKRASNQTMMNVMGITGYRHTDRNDVRNAAYISRLQKDRAMLDRAWAQAAAPTALSASIDKIVEKAAHWIDNATYQVKSFIREGFEDIEDTLSNNYSKIKNAFINAAETTSDAIEKGYENVSRSFSEGYAYAASGLKSGLNATGNFFEELTHDGMDMLRGTSIAGNLMATPKPAMAYTAPSLRI